MLDLYVTARDRRGRFALRSAQRREAIDRRAVPRALFIAASIVCALAGCPGSPGSDGGPPDVDVDGGPLPDPDAGPTEDTDGGPPDVEDAGPGPVPCGNGTLETSEVCEGFELRGATCASEGFTTGTLACTSLCTLDRTGCSLCGDGQITGGEVCEPNGLVEGTCATLVGPGFVGDLVCAPDCTQIDTSGCHQELPAPAFAACDPDATTPCAEPTLTCLATGAGDFCLEACALDDVDACGETGFCFDFDGVGICLERPSLGELCTPEGPCLPDAGNCVPVFGADESTVSMCADSCAGSFLGSGQGCTGGLSCLPVPSGEIELQFPQVACTDHSDCDEAEGFRCAPTSVDGSTTPRCMRPVTLCAEPIPFYAFDGTSTSDALCDLQSPTQGLRLCGIGANTTSVPGPMAIAVCYPLLPQQDDLGVCSGFCDSEVLLTTVDGFCGDGFVCDAPPVPTFALPEDAPVGVSCDPASPSCTSTHPDCLDLGRGPECSRPARMCVPQ